MKQQKYAFCFIVLLCTIFPMQAQLTLSLDSCRALAIRNNKELAITKIKQEASAQNRKAAQTKYLPHVDAMGGYLYTNKEVSILTNEQKGTLHSLGTNTAAQISTNLSPVVTQMVQGGLISAQQAQALSQIISQAGPGFASALNSFGDQLVKDFRTDTRHMWGGSVMLTQPIYMGGKIVAYNKITNAAEKLARSANEAELQNTLLTTDEAYWLVVSLKHKQRLAQGFYDLVKRLEDDVTKMIDAGVATKADGLSVSVKVNEAEMSLTQVEDGLTLSRMALCQHCGLPLDTQLTLADEDNEQLSTIGTAIPHIDTETALGNRPEIKMLELASEMNRQNVNVVRADYLPSLALTGGYLFSNPSTFNGFEKKIGGIWNVGVMMKMPLWNWLEGTHKVKSAKANVQIAQMQLDEAREKIELQITQSQFKVTEAQKKLAMANKNIDRAEENLRSATLGFKEGVIPTSNVLEAQTAWLQAQSQKIDAEIDVKLTEVSLRKALGILK